MCGLKVEGVCFDGFNRSQGNVRTLAFFITEIVISAQAGILMCLVFVGKRDLSI